jgi:ATP-dependent helicase/nuclease subunit A
VTSDASKKQLEATNPVLSAWVTANAGSGKTHVLVNRIARLLLSGSSPDRLLCLTFTKAAAAEMSERLFKQLGDWALMPDDKLQLELFKLSGQAPDDGQVGQARRLFAEALESPGGLRIQTIHAFCEGLLKRFPLESGVAPQFSVLDEQATDELLASARDRVLRDGIAGDAELLRVVTELTAFAGDTRLDELLRDTINARSWVMPFLTAHGRQGIAAALRAKLNIAGINDEEGLLQATMSLVPAARAGSIAAALYGGGKTDAKRADCFAAYGRAPGTETLRAMLDCLLTKEGEIASRLVTKGVLEDHPEIGPQLDDIALLAKDVRNKRNALHIARHTGNLLLLAKAIFESYESLKQFHAALDYDDLINKTAALFRSPGAHWVLYKLDGGIDHILIDEAQDTSPSQWEIVRAMADEFFAGRGAERKGQPIDRTIFAVGDIKQSIMSFQGARPLEFVKSQKLVKERADHALATFEHVSLIHSFRSATSILELVDEVFADKAAADGVLIEEAGQAHIAHRKDDRGFVEVWPLIEQTETQDPPAWDAPRDRVSADHPAVVLAGRIASRIRQWIAEGVMVHTKSDGTLRPMTAGDVMILVRRRGLLSSEIIRQLKRMSIRVAGADRLVLADHIAVMDLIALGRFALMPHDDLTLATVLRGPCCGLSDEDLFALAHGRGEKVKLWSVRCERADDPRWREAHAFLQRLRDMADHVQPYEFYSTILGPMGGWTRMTSRLGLDAADPIEEFLGAAIDFGSMHTPSLERFLHVVERAETEIKRDQDRSDNAVRVLTVHGSKGLEAPIVILPDTFATPEHGRHDSELLQAGDTPLWKIKSTWDEDVRKAARQEGLLDRMREYRRLLYVALTRPRDQLYVCGYEQKISGTQASWYRLVDEAMRRRNAREVEDADGTRVLRLGDDPAREVPRSIAGCFLRRPKNARTRPSRRRAMSRGSLACSTRVASRRMRWIAARPFTRCWMPSRMRDPRSGRRSRPNWPVTRSSRPTCRPSWQRRCACDASRPLLTCLTRTPLGRSPCAARSSGRGGGCAFRAGLIGLSSKTTKSCWSSSRRTGLSPVP